MRRPHSYSSISTYRKCPKYFHWCYVLGNKTPPNASADRGTELHSLLEEFFKGGSYPSTNRTLKPWQRFMEALTVHKVVAEMECAVTSEWNPAPYESEGAYARGKFDLRSHEGDNVHIYDWKSGRIYDSHKGQAEMYVALDMTPYVGAHYYTHFVYLDIPLHVETMPYSLAKKGAIRDNLKTIIDTINDATEYKATPSTDSCKYCPLSWRKGGECREAV